MDRPILSIRPARKAEHSKVATVPPPLPNKASAVTRAPNPAKPSSAFNGRLVLPRSRREIEQLAAQIRADLGLSADGRVAMEPLLGETLYEVVPGYSFRVGSEDEMRGLDGLTDDRRPIIYLRDRVYAALERGDGQARMTAAHEFGHLVMHCRAPTYHARSDEYQPLWDPERQADIFASAFLMPEAPFRRCRSTDEAMQRFGVSLSAATCRARKLHHRFKPTRPTVTAGKKKGSNNRRTP